MGTLSDLSRSLSSQFSRLSSEEAVSKDGSSFLLIRRRDLSESISSYLPSLYVVILSDGKCRLLSYHGKILKEEEIRETENIGGLLALLNAGKLFPCPGMRGILQDINESLLKEVFTEPSVEGGVLFRSRSCSFFKENTPGLCGECQIKRAQFQKEELYDQMDIGASIKFEGSPSTPLSWFNDIESEDEIIKKTPPMKLRTKECPKCFKVFNFGNSFNSHIRRCRARNEENEDFSVLEVTEESSSLSKDCPLSSDCEVCLQKFNRKGSYYRHLRLHSERMNLDELVNCPLCGDGSHDRRSLNSHIHASHDSTKGCCAVCYEFVPNELLARHFERMHNYNVKKHLCPECGQKFRFPGELKYHVAYAHDDTGEKSVVCDQCGKVFPHRKALTKHLRGSHNKTKTYTCDKCDRVFFENYRLQKHLQIHSGVKPYKCMHCEYCSARKDNVMLHMRKIHKMSATSSDVVTLEYLIKTEESISNNTMPCNTHKS